MAKSKDDGDYRHEYQEQGSADEPVQDVEDAEEPVETADAPQEEATPTPEEQVSTPQSDASSGTRPRYPWEADPTADVKKS